MAVQVDKCGAVISPRHVVLYRIQHLDDLAVAATELDIDEAPAVIALSKFGAEPS